MIDATIESVDEGACEGTAPEDNIICRRIGFRLLEGPDADTIVSIELPSNSARITTLGVGDEVLLGYQSRAAEEFEYVFLDPQRKPALLLLAAVFAVAVVLLGRLHGFAALAGLGATLAVLFWFILPSILDERSPLLVALVGAAAISFLALYVAHGFGIKTTVALLGTLGGLACTAVLAVEFMSLASITGLASEEAFTITALGSRIDLEGLTLGGVIIGALGAIDDMTVTQASAVWEIRAADPLMSRRLLIRAGMRVGRDHVASTVNTLVLAYAGASLPLLILFVLSRQSFGTVANNEILATEIVRTLVGSVGLVASVPITTWLAAWVAPTRRVHKHRTPLSPPAPPEAPVAPLEPDEEFDAGPSEQAIPEHRWDAWSPIRFLKERLSRWAN